MTERFTRSLSTPLCLSPGLRYVELCKPWCGRRMFAAFALWIALLAVYPVSAQPAASIKILERGIYRAETVGQRPAPGTTGIINTVQNPQLISSTSTVVGQVGLRFGLRYSLVGAEAGSKKVLRLVIVFPLAGLRNPQTGQVHFQNEHEMTVPAGAALYWEYHFENQWEVVEGVWQFEFWDGANKLRQQRFCVHRLENRAPTTGLSRECRQDFLG